ncbi:MAG: methyltransferase domain-containing protein [Deltaproteobacteria bacterium]|nr:methyltransferase domain-containing protein [Deltaproteobacteria bacterium]
MTWLRRPRRDSAAALVRAATEAIARPESLDARSLTDRFAALARAAQDAAESKFTQSLIADAPALMGYLLSFELDGAPPELIRTYSADAFGRFLNTLDVTPRPVTGSVLEIGAGPYLFHVLLRAVFPGAKLVGSNFFEHDIFSTRIGKARQRLHSPRLGLEFDFDFPTFNLETVHPYPYAEHSFDVVYFCETLEHLVVNPLRVFRELRRILRPGGHLVLTLPTALRMTNVAAMLAGRNIFDLYCVGNGVHGRHNREFSLGEVRALLERDGFEVVTAETRDRLDYDTVAVEAVDYSGPPSAVPFRREQLEGFIRQSGGSTADRGDNIYVVARRKAQTGPPRGPRPVRPELTSEALVPQPDSDRLVSFLDVLEKRASGLHLTGWAFFTDDASGQPAEASIVVRGPSGAIAHRAEGMARADVASAHGLEHDGVGFQALLHYSALPPPPFDLCLRLRDSSGQPAERRLHRWEGPVEPDPPKSGNGGAPEGR